MSSKCQSLYIDRGLSESSNYCDLDKIERRAKSHKTSLHVLAPCKGRILLEFSVKQTSLKVQISQAEFPKINLQETLEPHLKINFTLSSVEKHLVPYIKLVSTAPDFTLRYDSCCLFHNLNMNQRLIISSYLKDGNEKIDILGSMSFGIRKLLESDLLSGWYYLLKESIGHKKHLKVYQETIPRSLTSNALCSTETEPMSDILSFDLFRKNDEFGFTICGNQPSFVGKVENSSPAHLAGLQPNDIIVKISHLLVFSCSAKAVAQILRLYPDSVTVTIFRNKRSDIVTTNAFYDNAATEPIKTKSKTKPMSWFKKMMSSKRNSSLYSISSVRSESDFYKSNIKQKSEENMSEGGTLSYSSHRKGDPDCKNNIIERLQYLGDIPPVIFSSNNSKIEYESCAWLLEPGNHIEVTLLLFPLVLLISQKEPDGFHTVIKPPIIINFITYLSIPKESKYEVVLQHINPSGIKEFVHLQCDCSEELVNLIKQKRRNLQNNDVITVK